MRYLEYSALMAGTVKLTREQLTVSQHDSHIFKLLQTTFLLIYCQGKDIEGALTPVHEKVNGVKKSISALVGKMEAGRDQLNW